MNWDDEFFLAARVALAGLCFYAGFIGWRMGMGYVRRPDRRMRGLVGAALMVLVGLLHLGSGLDEGIRKAGIEVELINWVWLGVDSLVPLFFLRMAHAFAARDRLEAELAEAATHDPLTGLPNRMGFARLAEAALSRAARQGQPSVAVMLDIDHFKAVNDGWGHGAGDVLLKSVADAAQAAIRREDALGRVGGEEFAMVLPGLTPEEALPLVNRMREAIMTSVPHPGAPERALTLSAGIAAVPHSDAVALEAAFNAADEALYAAKQGGRNQARISLR
ncbi:GGDEF domain-containing protein [Roseococcus sp. SDR]|uniref:GGDEF domain-containing protein n=1 Tax=Roseococcus sp. SDR TaxID=2835532 RepID=UPI001BD14336|nr:GGDEF domain-containing protein [Roseococcus sp. SDR]MBS7789882.1 GGDEF domain-containing protein [Roseococcus sp. SDR]MBV1845196.1 GGDEF domain-containing protein [Roseococcus sp. SDR]